MYFLHVPSPICKRSGKEVWGTKLECEFRENRNLFKGANEFLGFFSRLLSDFANFRSKTLDHNVVYHL